MKSIVLRTTVLVAMIAFFCPFVAIAGIMQVDGIFGVAPVSPETALAVWVPLSQEVVLDGVRWYNNDSAHAFPEVYAIAGVARRPGPLQGGTVVGVDVVGSDSGWSNLYFDRPLASETPGLYLVFKLPVDGEYSAEGNGGGAGLGYSVGDGVRRCWATGDGVNWDPLSSDMRLAAEPILKMDKSGDVLVLGGQVNPPEFTGEDGQREDGKAVFCASPNPFNPFTEIQFSLSASGPYELNIYDLRGQLVRKLAHGYFEAGLHSQEWNGKDGNGRELASGVYFVRLRSGDQNQVLRLALVR